MGIWRRHSGIWKGNMNNQPKPLAELIMTNGLGHITVIRVMENSYFSNFYSWFTRVGEKPDRISNRSTAPCLEDIPSQINKHALRDELKIVSQHVKYFNRRGYEQRLKMSPDELGLTKEKLPHEFFIALRTRTPRRVKS